MKNFSHKKYVKIITKFIVNNLILLIYQLQKTHYFKFYTEQK